VGITFKAGLKSSFAVEFINSWLLVLLNDDLGIPKSIQINRYVKTDTEKKIVNHYCVLTIFFLHQPLVPFYMNYFSIVFTLLKNSQSNLLFHTYRVSQSEVI
jgi:hypothetical protein